MYFKDFLLILVLMIRKKKKVGLSWPEFLAHLDLGVQKGGASGMHCTSI